MSTMGAVEEFISVCVTVFDTQAGTLRVASAGHPAAWLWHDREVRPLRATGPLAVSSANTHGNPAANTAAEALDQLGDSVAVYLDAGAGSSLVPSTIVDVTSDPPRVLREGRISRDELSAVVGALE